MRELAWMELSDVANRIEYLQAQRTETRARATSETVG